ncbi:MAG TPA: T9SS type A sorting domain-containing protein, partial [Chitinophagales bacterium]|nr:T9SS type A sorting domain-containing protein [Chitinophagales bacterium]
GPGGNIIVLPSNGTPPYTITWNDAFLSGDTIIGTWPGTYILTVTDANGCSVVDTVVVPIGTEISADQSDILVFPIPFSDLLQVSSTDLVWKIRVYTADGKLLYQQLPDQNFISIKTGSWPPGFYVMEIHTISTTLVTYVTKW